jgi:DNA-directed RNA polymerase specialized sigma subunit
MTDKHSFEINGILRNLVEKKVLIEEGYGKGKVYYLNHYFKNDINEFASYLKGEAQQKAQEEAQDKHLENKEEWLSTIEKKIVELLKKENKSKSDIANALGYESITGNLKRALKNLIDNGIIDYTIPDKLNSRYQQYKLTEIGKTYIM